MKWLDKLKAHKGDVYKPGQALPEPEYETATGRKLYTVHQIRAAYAQGADDSRNLLARCRNMLSHPAHWGAEEGVVSARYALYTEVLEHLNGLENSGAWTELGKQRRVKLQHNAEMTGAVRVDCPVIGLNSGD